MICWRGDLSCLITPKRLPYSPTVLPVGRTQKPPVESVRHSPKKASGFFGLTSRGWATVKVTLRIRNFSSNVDDLLDAFHSLSKTHDTPQLLIGHSLGGTAALMAAAKLPEVRAVATIGSPADPQHVTHLFQNSVEEIMSVGEATVDIAGRQFLLRKQFVEDLMSPEWAEMLSRLRCAKLICHSPVDRLVNIEEARRIYESLSHPKSFLSLDGADHLLVAQKDSQFVSDVLASWASRYLDETDADSLESAEAQQNNASPIADGELLVRELEGFTQEVMTSRHRLIADEPISVGGKDLGMNPYEYLLAAIGTCTSMTMRMYANHKGLPLTGISVRLKHHQIHAKDCEDCESEKGKISVIEKSIRVSGDLTPEQVVRLGEIADRCPVHRTLMSEKKINTQIELQGP